MIEVRHDVFTIKTDKKAPGTYRIVRTAAGGTMPIALLGNYTSVGLAKEDINRYRVRNSGGLSASKTRATRRGK